MKVLHVIPAYEPAWQAGGVVRAVSQLCRGLSDAGVDVTVYTTNTSGNGWLDIPTDRPVMVGGVEVFYFHTSLPKAFRYSRALGQMCEKTMGDFEIVHIASFWNYPGIPAASAAREQKIPYVISTHGTLVPYALQRSRLKKWLYTKIVERRNLRHAAAVHYTTEFEREATDHFGLTCPSFVVPNGLDFSEFERLPAPDVARDRLDLSKEDTVLTFLGRLDRSKGLEILLKAFARVAQDFSRCLLLLAGHDDGCESNLRKLTRDLDLGDRVRFLGFVGDEMRANLLTSTDLSLSLSLSRSENFCYSAVEAMAAGSPVMLSEHVGISPDVEADAAGIIVPAQVDIVARELAELLSCPALLKDMGRVARDSAYERYDIGKVARRMIAAYTDILTGRRSPDCEWSATR